MDGLEVHRERFQSLTVKDLTALDVLCSVDVVVSHVEPLQLICDVAFGQEL